MLSLRSVWQRNFRPSLTVLWELLRDGLQFLNVVVRSRTAVAAEVVFLRKQLAYYQDHQIRPRRLTDAARLSLVLWSPAFRVERSAHHRYTQDLCLLASQGFQTVLALEVAGRSAPAAQGHTPAHRPDGKGEHNLGRRARCR
jgi:hypothetical protein